MLRDKRTLWTGGLAVALGVLLALSLPAQGTAKEHEKPMAEVKANHFKCHPILDWTEFEPRTVNLKDQFGESTAYVVDPRLLCNPVDKNEEGTPSPESHLVCYEIKDRPAFPTERVKEVLIQNQLQQGPVWVGMANLLCVPSAKSYKPRG